MKEKERSEVVAKEEIRVAYDHFKQAQELRQKIKEMNLQLYEKLETAKSCFEVVKQLRWGKELLKHEIGEGNVYYQDLLRLFDGDIRE